jgi:hypothetical protein
MEEYMVKFSGDHIAALFHADYEELLAVVEYILHEAFKQSQEFKEKGWNGYWDWVRRYRGW